MAASSTSPRRGVGGASQGWGGSGSSWVRTGNTEFRGAGNRGRASGRVTLSRIASGTQTNGQAPAISGGASLGDALSCSPGGWKSDLDGASLFRAPRTFAYAWQLDGSDIPDATTSSFTFTEPGDYTCRVTAANEAGSSSQTSAAFTVTLLDVVKYYDKNTNDDKTLVQPAPCFQLPVDAS